MQLSEEQNAFLLFTLHMLKLEHNGNTMWSITLLLMLWLPASRAIPDSKVHGANMGPIWGRQDPGGPHVGPMNFAIIDGINAPGQPGLSNSRRRILGACLAVIENVNTFVLPKRAYTRPSIIICSFQHWPILHIVNKTYWIINVTDYMLCDYNIFKCDKRPDYGKTDMPIKYQHSCKCPFSKIMARQALT